MESLGLVNYYTYLAGVILVILLPGPNSLYVLAVAGRRGRQAAALAICGVFLGDFILMVATAIGAAALLKTQPLLFLVLKLGGAIYLSYIGLMLIRGAWLQLNSKTNTRKTLKLNNQENPFLRAFIISLMNPKAIFFLLSFFLPFVDPNASDPSLAFAILIATLQACSMIYLWSLVLIGGAAARYFGHHYALAATFGAAVGVIFVVFAMRLLFASMP